jgi:hypothetical protein
MRYDTCMQACKAVCRLEPSRSTVACGSQELAVALAAQQEQEAKEGKREAIYNAGESRQLPGATGKEHACWCPCSARLLL